MDLRRIILALTLLCLFRSFSEAKNVYGSLVLDEQQSTKERMVYCTKDNTTGILVYRDGRASEKGNTYAIMITDSTIVWFAGIGNSNELIPQYSYDVENEQSSIFPKIMGMVNKANLRLSDYLEPNLKRRGMSGIELFKGDNCWMNLVDSPQQLNAKGKLSQLVDAVTILLGGEPDYTEPEEDEPFDPFSEDNDYPIDL